MNVVKVECFGATACLIGRMFDCGEESLVSSGKYEG